MRCCPAVRFCAAAWLLSLLPAVAAQELLPPPATDLADAPALVDPAFTDENGAVPLEYGPIHEAFADVYSLDQRNGVVVDVEPPPAVDELPPEDQLTDERAVWINGYWMWDDIRSDFVWVSGVWRVMPPGKQWVPGYWASAEAGDQWVWTSGYWLDANAEQHQVEYLPAPPSSLEIGPNRPAPGGEYFWIPGCWRWNGYDYAWRTGRWYPVQSRWVWCPGYYNYTPRGCVYVAGYWDYPLARRGLLYAPVTFGHIHYHSHVISYRPCNVLDSSLLLSFLYVSNHRHCYYYGGRDFRHRGYHRWHDFYGVRRPRGGGGYDPLFAFYANTRGRQNPNWIKELDHVKSSGLDRGRGDRVVREVDDLRGLLVDRTRSQSVSDIKRGPIQLKPLGDEGQRDFRKQTVRLQELISERSKEEAKKIPVVARGDRDKRARTINRQPTGVLPQRTATQQRTANDWLDRYRRQFDGTRRDNDNKFGQSGGFRFGRPGVAPKNSQPTMRKLDSRQVQDFVKEQSRRDFSQPRFDFNRSRSSPPLIDRSSRSPNAIKLPQARSQPTVKPQVQLRTNRSGGATRSTPSFRGFRNQGQSQKAAANSKGLNNPSKASAVRRNRGKSN